MTTTSNTEGKQANLQLDLNISWHFYQNNLSLFYDLPNINQLSNNLKVVNIWSCILYLLYEEVSDLFWLAYHNFKDRINIRSVKNSLAPQILFRLDLPPTSPVNGAVHPCAEGMYNPFWWFRTTYPSPCNRKNYQRNWAYSLEPAGFTEDILASLSW